MAFMAALLVSLSCLVAGCSSDDVCDRACSAWAVDSCWDYDLCWQECKDEGDWSNTYATCCEDNAGDCISLEVICG